VQPFESVTRDRDGEGTGNLRRAGEEPLAERVRRPGSEPLAIVNVAVPDGAALGEGSAERRHRPCRWWWPGWSHVMVWQEMTSVYVALVPVQPFESVTVTVIGNVPGWSRCAGENARGREGVRPVGSVLEVGR